MRPIYERPEDRNQQAKAVTMLAQTTGTTAREMPELHFYDFDMIRDGKDVAIVEVKRRHIKRCEFSTFKIGTRKLNEVHDEAERRGIAGIILVQWDDALGYVSLARHPPSKWRVKQNDGRTVKTRDRFDIEPCSHADIGWFRVVQP